MHTIAFPVQSRLIALEMIERPYTTLEEAQVVCWLAQQHSGNILEIGSGSGVISRDLARTNLNKTVYALDCVEGHSPLVQDFSNVKVLTTPSAQLDYAQLETVKIIYIDADTSYEAVKSDTEKALAHLRAVGGGLIIWHHYDNVYYIRRPGDKVRVTAYLNAEIALKFPEFTEVASTRLAFLKI